jgi:flagellar basal body-associated protein FliL
MIIIILSQVKEKQNKPEKMSKKTWIILGVILAIIVIIVIIVIVTNKKKKKTTNTEPVNVAHNNLDASEAEIDDGEPIIVMEDVKADKTE